MGGASTKYVAEQGEKHVVVIGGGHAGCEVAKQLSATQSSIKITVISDKVLVPAASFIYRWL